MTSSSRSRTVAGSRLSIRRINSTKPVIALYGLAFVTIKRLLPGEFNAYLSLPQPPLMPEAATAEIAMLQRRYARTSGSAGSSSRSIASKAAGAATATQPKSLFRSSSNLRASAKTTATSRKYRRVKSSDRSAAARARKSRTWLCGYDFLNRARFPLSCFTIGPESSAVSPGDDRQPAADLGSFIDLIPPRQEQGKLIRPAYSNEGTFLGAVADTFQHLDECIHYLSGVGVWPELFRDRVNSFVVKTRGYELRPLHQLGHGPAHGNGDASRDVRPCPQGCRKIEASRLWHWLPADPLSSGCAAASVEQGRPGVLVCADD